MIFKSEVNFGELIKISSGGMSVATYSQIVDMLKTRYKEVYGSDIDLDPSSADGIWIHNISLLINNILQANQMLYRNLDVDQASGVYLENLCKLSNVYRKGATNSQARVKIKNLGNTPITLYGVDCIDVNGLVWSSTQTITLQSNGSTDSSTPPIATDEREILVICEQSGDIQAPIGSIKQVVNIDSNILVSVEQLDNAEIGSNEETDAELKARRNDSNSPIGITTIDSLVGAILNIAGVRDCMIVNNYTNSTMADGKQGTLEYKGYDNTQIPPHSIYIVLRYNGVVNEKDIADTIFQKLTAGVQTTEVDANVSNGTGASETNYPYIYAPTNDGFTETIYWKVADPIQPEITITLDTYSYFNPNNVEEIIGKGLIEYLNNLQLNTDLNIDDIKMQTLELDPMFKGRATYGITSVVIDDDPNTLTYYNYTSATYNPTTKVLTIA